MKIQNNQITSTKESAKKEILPNFKIEPTQVTSQKESLIKRIFTQKSKNPHDEVNWIKASASITNPNGETVFEQNNLEFPENWSQTAINIVTSKYFYGEQGTPEREYSLKQLIDRVVQTITRWGMEGKYFNNKTESQTFNDELTFLLLNQYAAFNSPVWFNCGIEEKPQCSACFINSVEDTMGSILDLAKTEGMLFKWGSGTGTNLSTLRSSKEKVSGGGKASGPVSFMKGFDAFAGVIKSGGKTRRAAKMVILNDSHPDVVDFIECKEKEEKKAWALIDAGYDGSIDGDAYTSVFFQNSNNSVRVSDDFMQAVVDGKEWQTKAIKGGAVVDTYQAKDLMKKISQGTYVCGDPGLQYDTTMQKWHTCKKSGRINATNPCSEYVFLDDSACNLASLNLLKFRKPDLEFDTKSFKHAVSVMITAMEIIVGNASYPSPKIEENSHLYRPLGLGYANLGALIMSRGLAYDSDEGRAYSAAITALLGGEAYKTSALLSNRKGSFDQYEINRDSMLEVIKLHQDAANDIFDTHVSDQSLLDEARNSWDAAYLLGEKYGYRNAQVTVLAPTGTIGFMMDCDTTGVEPDIALVKYKKLVGGGLFKMINQTVPQALSHLGYQEEEIKDIETYIDQNDGIEGAPHLKEEHLSIFDCAFKAPHGERSIHYRGHLKMMSAVQPFISGAISKTVNMPKEATVGEISKAYIDAWKLGVKCVAIYREGSKRIQPLNTSKEGADKTKAEELTEIKIPHEVRRRRLPDERNSITHKFSIAGHEGYLTIGLFNDGTPGEIFVRMSKEGSTISGLMDTVATCTSIMLQYGVPLEFLVKKFTHTRFEPQGITPNPHIRFAKSIIDYIFRYLAYKFLSPEVARAHGVNQVELIKDSVQIKEKKQAMTKEAKQPLLDEKEIATLKPGTQNKAAIKVQEDAPPCSDCGALMVRSGSCYKCLECGSTSGCS